MATRFPLLAQYIHHPVQAGRLAVHYCSTHPILRSDYPLGNCLRYLLLVQLVSTSSIFPEDFFLPSSFRFVFLIPSCSYTYLFSAQYIGTRVIGCVPRSISSRISICLSLIDKLYTLHRTLVLVCSCCPYSLIQHFIP